MTTVEQITARQVREAYLAWKQANDLALLASMLGYDEETLNRQWEAEARALAEYTRVYNALYTD